MTIINLKRASKYKNGNATDYFPYESFRPYQREAIERAQEAFGTGKRFVVAEMPTGAGKSGIAATFARYFGESYIITAAKTLQEQYIRDFGNEMVDLKGRNAYECWLFNKEKSENTPVRYCNRGLCKMRGKSSLPECFNEDLKKKAKGYEWILCPYFKRLNEAKTSPHTIFNFSSFLFQANYAMQFDKRKLLIVDEAHNIESQIMNFVEISLSDRYLKGDGIEFPKYETPQEYASYFEKKNLRDYLKRKISSFKKNGDIDAAEKWAKTMLRFDTFMEEVNETEFVAEYKFNKEHGGYSTVTLKPLYVKKYAPEYLLRFGDKVLLLSATILDHKVFCGNLGIPLGMVEFISVPCTFPVKNRLIRLRYAGSMSYKNRDETQPVLLDKIEKALTLHDRDRGIIHSHSFGITNYIRDNISRKFKNRLLFQENFNSKDELLQEHASSKNGVIVAPAMHEGLDLKDDLSRFQIICKVPYPDANNDRQLKMRTRNNWHYYLWLTALKLVQSYGRSIRSETDVAQTYILDSDFNKFVKMARKMLPPWFMAAILW